MIKGEDITRVCIASPTHYHQEHVFCWLKNKEVVKISMATLLTILKDYNYQGHTKIKYVHLEEPKRRKTK